MDAFGGLLTKGLGGNCCSLILSQFHLGKCCISVTVTDQFGVSGGSIPMQPGEIHNFYQPVTPKQTPQYLNYTNAATPYKTVTIKIDYNSTQIEKTFSIPANKYMVIVKTAETIRLAPKTIIASVKKLQRVLATLLPTSNHEHKD